MSVIGSVVTSTTRGPAPESRILDSTLPKWFAVYTTARHEKRIAEYFRLRQIEYFLPLYRSKRRWKDGSKVTLELPLFASYIFVRIPRTARVRVLEVPGVITMVGSGCEPVPVADFEIDSLRVGLRARKIEPHPLLTIGERARIKAGAMAGMEGIVVRKNNNLRVVLTLDLIMQSVAVEVDGDDLEPVGMDSANCNKLIFPRSSPLYEYE